MVICRLGACGVGFEVGVWRKLENTCTLLCTRRSGALLLSRRVLCCVALIVYFSSASTLSSYMVLTELGTLTNYNYLS